MVAKIIVPVKYEEIERLGDAQFYFYEVYKESCDCVGLYTMDGDPVIPCGSKYNFFRIERIKNYDGYEIKGDVGSVYDDYKVGVFSLEGKRMIIPCEYKKLILLRWMEPTILRLSQTTTNTSILPSRERRCHTQKKINNG